MRNSCKGLVEHIVGTYDCAAEIGIGHFPDVALSLANRGVRVFATDIKPFQHNDLKVVVDDISRPDFSLYAGLNLIYSLRPPLELVPYMERLAKAVSADLIVKPLASEYPGGQLISKGNTTFFLWNDL
ncbi:MAG: hypothetical protein HWN69_08690 [Desulfobacterales bacterium]|nr:hypothetical protein [Desulfobacterales bacterium]